MIPASAQPSGPVDDNPHVNYEELAKSVESIVQLMRDEKPKDAVRFFQNRFEVHAQALRNKAMEEASPLVHEGLRKRGELSMSFNSERYGEFCPVEIRNEQLIIVVLGASGDLAKKKTFPALFRLFVEDAIPPNVRIVGYARSKMERQDFHKHIVQYLPKDLSDHFHGFLNVVTYVQGAYNDVSAFQNLNTYLNQFEQFANSSNRVFYLAIPPTAFLEASNGIRQAAMASNGWTRVVIEKPFGTDTESSAQLSRDLTLLFQENQIYRIDHYLGKEMVQNMVTFRFANHMFNAVWSNKHIHNVQITFKETIGTEGRGGYFDSFGIIRDVIQNHLTQILALVAMEKPASLSAEHIRDEKVRVLQSALPIKIEDCVIGQYTKNEATGEPGYLDDPTVPKGSKTPTFAAMVLRIHNDRWDGVPFIIKAGKAMDRKQVLVRIQFRDEIQPFGEKTSRNELVIRAQPQEAMYLKISAKSPGVNRDEVIQTELDLSYHSRYEGLRLPDAYEALIREVVLGNSTNFVRSDELDAAWKIYTPLLHAIDAGKLNPIPYAFGSRGPSAADEMLSKTGFIRSRYEWKK